MSATLTPIEIENQKFDLRMRGYDRAQVRAFLAAIGEEFTRLISEQGRALDEMRALRGQVDAHREREKKVGDSLLALRELSERSKEESRREAELVLREARAKADRLVEDARMEAVRLESEIAAIRIDRETFEGRLRMLIEEHQRLLNQRHRELDRRDSVHFGSAISLEPPQ